MGDLNLVEDQLLRKEMDTSHRMTDTWEEGALIAVAEALVAVVHRNWWHTRKKIQNYGMDLHRCYHGSLGFLQTCSPATLGNAVGRDEQSPSKTVAVNDMTSLQRAAHCPFDR